MLRTAPILGALLALAAPALAQTPDPRSPTPESFEALRERGARTAKLLQEKPAAWTLFYEVNEDFVLVEVVSAPRLGRTMEVAIERLGARTKVLSILETEGRWLVAEADGISGAFRPWEAPLVHAALLTPLARALRPETAADAPPELAAPRFADARSVTWAHPSPPEARQALERGEEELRAWRGESPENRPSEAVLRSRQAYLERTRRELAEGYVTKIERDTGLVLVSGPPGGRRALSSFAWLPEVPAERFAAAGAPPLDLTSDPTQGDLTQLALLGQAGDWQPQASEVGARITFDARLVNVQTGVVRRVPFDLGPCLPGCFSADRRRVYVTARAPSTAAGLWEVDLRTRAKRRLGPEELATGECAFPALAPDGKTLAVIHRPPGAHEGRVQLVDLATGAARPLGPALDGGCLAWLPTGKALLLAVRRDGMQLLVRLDLDGRLEPLRPGSLPLVLPDGATVAFLDPATGAWCKTRLEPGAEAEPWLGGLRGHGSPALSPDGKRLLLVDAQGASGRPGPALIDLATGARRPLEVGRGAWGFAAWR